MCFLDANLFTKMCFFSAKLSQRCFFFLCAKFRSVKCLANLSLGVTMSGVCLNLVLPWCSRPPHWAMPGGGREGSLLVRAALCGKLLCVLHASFSQVVSSCFLGCCSSTLVSLRCVLTSWSMFPIGYLFCSLFSWLLTPCSFDLIIDFFLNMRTCCANHESRIDVRDVATPRTQQEEGKILELLSLSAMRQVTGGRKCFPSAVMSLPQVIRQEACLRVGRLQRCELPSLKVFSARGNSRRMYIKECRWGSIFSCAASAEVPRWATSMLSCTHRTNTNAALLLSFTLSHSKYLGHGSRRLTASCHSLYTLGKQDALDTCTKGNFASCLK